MPLNIIALISGGGRTVLNLQDEIDSGALDARIDLVVSSRSDAAGLSRAADKGLETATIPSGNYRVDGRMDWSAMSTALDQLILPRRPDLVILAGFMCFYQIPDALNGRVMNIHPALIPSFCGQGMWGHHVHEAVLESGVKVSGCTVHFVTNEYDAGPIILQRTCPVLDTDDADALASRVFAEECRAFPDAIRLFAENRLTLDGNRVRLSPSPEA